MATTTAAEPHYPTSAELASMRRMLADRLPNGDQSRRAVYHVPADGGAWPHERERGIGYRDNRPYWWDNDPLSIARREANRMRRAAAERAEFLAGLARIAA